MHDYYDDVCLQNFASCLLFISAAGFGNLISDIAGIGWGISLCYVLVFLTYFIIYKLCWLLLQNKFHHIKTLACIIQNAEDVYIMENLLHILIIWLSQCYPLDVHINNVGGRVDIMCKKVYLWIDWPLYTKYM